MATSFTLPFIKKERLAKDTYSFYFDRTKETFNFLPGQYMRMILPHANPDDRGTSRYFTISSSPHEKEHLMITTKIPQSTFKKALANLEPGTKVQFFGPIGYFIEKIESDKPFVFLAGGIGITPFYSLLKHAAHKKLTSPFALFASFSKPENIIFHKELTELSNKNKNIKTIFTTERFSEKLLKEKITDIYHPNYYIVGPPSMVEETKQMLENLEINSEQIFTEDFTGY